MEAAEVTDWKNIPFLPISINFLTFVANFDSDVGEWIKVDLKEREDTPELKRLGEDLESLKTKNDILLDMLTVKDLDLIEAQKLKKELEDLVSRSEN
ncbi:hypothetical protein SteCoe_10527 [Stentor coeruleus]|uniref:Uncharacterized protein n=1 Tax=Stentor coeruleus TaxID=5963 RepID=A0A1R2CFB0_9CILI|nr:hypothetical protein SteCoe_10527 [Stentor coeruleus]